MFSTLRAVSRTSSTLFKRVISSTSKTHTISPDQATALSEQCILVNENDQAIGSASKRDCHKIQENGKVLLHRAFSVLLFNTGGKMLLQKRAASKVTFPSIFSNSCCSHPLHDFPEEREEANASGIKAAAMRRLNIELGIPRSEMNEDEFTYLTRIQYEILGNNGWGEHEIDYILFFQKNVTLKPNSDEVSDLVYVSKNNFEGFLNSNPISPWFRLMVENHLDEWWKNLSSLKMVQDHVNITRY